VSLVILTPTEGQTINQSVPVDVTTLARGNPAASSVGFYLDGT